MRHLCNTFIDGGEKAEKEWLDPLLKEDIAAIPPVLRVSADVTKMLHALAKCLGEGIELYGKGEGAKGFRPWLEEHAEYKTALYLHLSRVDKGCRQDMKTEAAFAAYWNRPMNVAYLDPDNVLTKNLYIMLTSPYIIATMRGRAAFHDKVTTRLRFFSASNKLDKWSALDMAQVRTCARPGKGGGGDARAMASRAHRRRRNSVINRFRVSPNKTSTLSRGPAHETPSEPALTRARDALSHAHVRLLGHLSRGGRLQRGESRFWVAE